MMGQGYGMGCGPMMGQGMGPGMMGMMHGMMGRGMGQGMMGGSGMGSGMMMGPGMMGGSGMGPGMMGGYYGSEQQRKFLDETATLRKKIHGKQFEYFEASRDPKASREKLMKLERELFELRQQLQEKAWSMMKK